MKIYICGSVASGKSTLARRISGLTGIPCHHLDEVLRVPDPSAPWGNRKRPDAEWQALFADILSKEDYIMEDAGRACFVEGMEMADVILVLEPPLRVRQWRIVLRWVRQNLGIEKCIYRPDLNMLRHMFKWVKSYETGADGVKARVAPYREKTVVLRSERDVQAYLASAFAPCALANR